MNRTSASVLVRIGLALVIAPVLVACAEVDTDAALPPTTTVAVPEDGEPVTVGRVLDGDTFEARTADDRRATVRLLGVNAPEEGECLADDARSELDALLGDGQVVLVADVTDRDPFGRLLRYAFAGDVFVNAQLVSDGMGLSVASPADVAYQSVFETAEGEAQQSDIGVWNPSACGPPTSTDLHIVRTDGDPTGPDDTNLNGEYVVIANEGDDSVSLDAWVLRDTSSQNRFHFPAGFELGAGHEVTVRSGTGPDSDGTLHWNSAHPIWDNDGDTAFLVDPRGNVVSYTDIKPAD